jgi:hypothetical protein
LQRLILPPHINRRSIVECHVATKLWTGTISTNCPYGRNFMKAPLRTPMRAQAAAK